MALLRAPVAGALVHRNSPLRHHSSPFGPSSSSSSTAIPTLKGLFFREGTRRSLAGNLAFVDSPSSLPPVRCFRDSGGRGSKRDERGVEDADADVDMEALLARLQRKLVVDVHPLQETRREEEEAVRKGREMLFRQLCLHLGVAPREFRAMWRARGGGPGGGGGGGAEEEEKLRLVREFLEDWGWRHCPLSPRAAVEMLEEHMGSSGGRAAAAAARPPPAVPSAPPRRLLPNWWWR